MKTTLVLPARHTHDAQKLWRSAIRRGWKTHRVTGWHLTQGDVSDAGRFVIYGESILAPQWAEVLGVTLVEAEPQWLTQLPRELVRRDLVVTTLETARQMAENVFVKPLLPKDFRAAVYGPNASDWSELDDRNDDERVLTSTPVQWASEFRCFMLDARCVTASPYLRRGELCETESGEWPWLGDEESEVVAFVESVARAFPPANGGTVIDVGWISDFGWAVIEANDAWGSGLYGCDADAALDVIDAACIQAVN